jgi:hypothetical protein
MTTITAEDIIEHMRARLAAINEMIELGVALPGAVREVENLRILLDIFETRHGGERPSGERGKDWGSA